MNGRTLLLVMVLAAIVGGITATRVLLTSGAGGIAATQPTSLPFVPAPGAGITPGPTLTPIPRPDSAVQITATKARELGVRVSGGDVEDGTVSVTLEEAGDYSYFKSHEADYPVWIWTAKGAFHPSYGPRGVGRTEYQSARIFIDAITGEVMRVQLRDEVPVDSADNTSQ